MIKPIPIIAGEPNSISSEIICKSWKYKNKIKCKPFFIIGSLKLFKMQINKLGYNINIFKINEVSEVPFYFKKGLPFININFNQKKPFENISFKSQKYIFKCFEKAIELIDKKEVDSLINCPISKEYLLGDKYNGITEFLSKKFNLKDNEIMLIYSKKLSVSPLTTHIKIKHVAKKLNKKLLIKKITNLSNFYKKNFNIKPLIGILSLNPHGNTSIDGSEEKNIIMPALKILRKKNIRVFGPFSADTVFIEVNKLKLNVVVGMYHDQILPTIKALFKFKAINITLGLPFARVSPDHGVASNIMGKKIADPSSLIECLKFLSKKK